MTIAKCVDYPDVEMWIEIWELDGKFYLQDVWNSDYYEITDSFKDDIYRWGIDEFDYHIRTPIE